MSVWHKALALFAACAAAPACGADLAPPAFRLGDAARPERYEAQLAIDPREAAFTGRIRIELAFARETPVLWLNATGLALEAVEAEQSGRAVAVKVLPGGEDFVGFHAHEAPFAPGPAILTVRYRGRFEANATRGLFRQRSGDEWYVLSQFEALSARRAFPCFDEPGYKTPWRLTIDAPEANVVASNTPAASSTPVPGSTWRRHAFAATPPLPSYLVALAVGPFDVVDGGRAGARGTPLRYLAPRGRGDEMRWAKEATPRLLELAEAYFGIPYPFEKLDSVVIPQLVAFGAMENVGLITYGARFILARPHEETDVFRRRYASLAAHEIAHMWFGNLVTLAWWDDIWLNEAFASWVGDKVARRFRPEWDDGVYRAQSRARAIAVDRLSSTRVIAQPVASLGDMSGAFDAITYDKGREVLSMFEAAFGEARFRDGVRLFLRRHEWSTATSRDFFGAIAEASGQGPAAIAAFESFVRRPGAPLVDAKLQCGAGGARLALAQSRLRPVGSAAADERWTIPMCVLQRRGGKDATQCAQLPPEGAPLDLGAGCPEWVLGNAGGAGHYVMRYDAALAKRIRAGFARLPAIEALTLVTDARLLWSSGLAAADAALDWAGAGLRHASPAVAGLAARLLEDLLHAPLPESVARRREAAFARGLVPLAARLGWTERAGEALAVRELRLVALPIAAQSRAGAALRPKAREEALRWLADPASVGGVVAPAVLEAAARHADAATYERLEAALLAASGDQERATLLRALGSVADPRLRERALRLALERLDPADAYSLVNAAFHDPGNRGAALAFFRAHFEPLVAKLPPHSAARLMLPLAQLCTPRDREAFVATFSATAPRFQGGPFRYRQALESIDLCVARAAQEARSTEATKARPASRSPSPAPSSAPPMSSMASSP